MTRRRFSGKHGFTLIELLLAVFIFAIVVGTLFGSYRAVMSSVEGLSAGMDLYEMATTCLDRMIRDVESARISQAPAWCKPNPMKTDEEADPLHILAVESDGETGMPRFRFASLAHVSQRGDGREGLAEIVYYADRVEREGEEINILRRADRLPPWPEEFVPSAADPVLCEQVKSFEVLLYDAEGEEYTAWDSESSGSQYATPKAVAFRMEIGDEHLSHYFETMAAFPAYRRGAD
ncbi:MAG: hypothetical protein CSB33_02970 [Desulfobacterales bacterium]|nr:MAG: hypothetical protein CSB33_02970 [Desulfobacterales bacterium]